MRLEGRRESTNVEDRRGTTVKAGGLGIGTLLVIGVIYMMMGGNPLSLLNSGILETATQTTQTSSTTSYEGVDQELVTFSKQILAGTEDVWTAIFRQMGKQYVPPKLVIFDGRVQSGCGSATSQSGPFYCSADQCVYLDLSFFKNMKREIGADGDFAYAYVIAHEVGHHVQNLLGTLQSAHSQMSRVSQTESNRISVRLELQADFDAGVWAYNDNKMFNSLEDGDIEEAVNAAAKIGDDYLQKQAQGYTVPDAFNHGTSAQRMRWLKKGLSTGDYRQGDTFSPNYNSL
ncbi:MAG: neutral zinc metallopeptidase [Bacteroidales bacterium]|nr:neutral zinc metallopeptidase [Bacteroidales bacterium]